MKKSAVLILVIVLIALVGLNAVFTVRENEYACTVRFSKIIDTTDSAGLHFKVPFLDSVKYFTKATQFYDIPPSEVLTSDKQNMTVDCYILWSISDPKLFYQTLGSTAVAEQRLDALTYNELKTVMGTLAQSDIINMNDGAERNQIYEGISADVDALAKTYGIRVEDVKIKQFDLPESNLNAVYSRMISERKQMAESTPPTATTKPPSSATMWTSRFPLSYPMRMPKLPSWKQKAKRNICVCWPMPTTPRTSRHSMSSSWPWKP